MLNKILGWFGYKIYKKSEVESALKLQSYIPKPICISAGRGQGKTTRMIDMIRGFNQSGKECVLVTFNESEASRIRKIAPDIKVVSYSSTKLRGYRYVGIDNADYLLEKCQYAKSLNELVDYRHVVCASFDKE